MSLEIINELVSSPESSMTRESAASTDADFSAAPVDSMGCCLLPLLFTMITPVIAAAAATVPIPMNSPPRRVLRLMFLYSRGLLSG